MKCSFFNIVRQIRENGHMLTRSLLLAGMLGLGALASADAGAATIWTGATNNVWNTGVTGNWTGGTGTNFTNGDNVVFDNTGANKSISVGGPVVPGTLTFNNTAGNDYTFATTATNTIGGSGGTTISSNGTVIYSPTNAGAHSFGTGAIVLSNAGSKFVYTPTTAGSTLTNDFVINAGVIWDKQSPSNGTRTGTVTVNSNFTLRNDGTFPGIMDANMLLTGNRTITGGLYFNFPRIAGNVTSSGGPRDLTVLHNGQNPDWQYYVGNGTSTPAWNIKNLIRSSGGPVSQRSGTLNFDVDEQTFFSNVEANGGQVYVEGDTRFLRSNTVEMGFNMIVKENNSTDNGGVGLIGTGFRFNSKFNINSGGLLGGNGTMRRRDDLSATTGALAHQLPVDVEAFAGGKVSPGDATAVDVTDILTIQGNMKFTGGTLEIDVTGGGQVAGVDYDKLVVQDSATPSGKGIVSGLSTANLVIDFHNVPFSALDGDVLTILTDLNNLSGQQFGTVTGLNTNGYWFSVVYGNGFIQLTNFTSTIPEPSSVTLLGLGLVGFALRRRRRKLAV